MAAVKVSLITASSAGLGAAIAKRLAAANYNVAINYHSSPSKAEAVLEEMEDSIGHSSTNPSGRFLAVQADISSVTEIRRLVDEVVSRFGRLDVVVSNGGWTRITNFTNLDDNIDEADWDRCWNMNVKSHLILLHAATKHLGEQDGAFVTIASVAGVKPSGSSVPYAVTKAAQIYLVKCLAGIVSPRVRVNSISPGILMTDWGRQFSAERLQIAQQKSSLKRFATVEACIHCVQAVAENKSMTGINSVLDAGFLLG
ncbi:alcohol dehydrogenase [Exophiala aquamarina CBS 119918]|uniref:Alcohol dehydrogenase n=1 Tax=Exophiala aquamarina CBS 119918 TaxID=1182545 RepID=A0A072P9X7_9EURO|nr:alcohol dehydrogenase [Exophiala aquamarina CBS 119918]KEF52340.1 alcohol dehydrogenase [Exophiala aquamarina CBS 119918]